jgi:hypothetical protein
MKKARQRRAPKGAAYPDPLQLARSAMREILRAAATESTPEYRAMVAAVRAWVATVPVRYCHAIEVHSADPVHGDSEVLASFHAEGNNPYTLGDLAALEPGGQA